MEIVSLRTEETLTLSKMFKVSGSIRRVIVMSAYIDIESIDELIKFLSDFSDSRGRPTLKIYIDKSSSRFFSNRKINMELLSRQNKIKSIFCNNSGIFLVQFGKLFHSKVYLVEGNKKGKLLFGSMNLTQKGINDNEEVLLVDNYEIGSRSISSKISKWVMEYSEKLNQKSTLVVDGVHGNFPSCMRQFLLDGSIYYELKEQAPFRFKLKLPDSVIKQKADIDRLLESNITDTISLESLISDKTHGLGKELPKLENVRSYWKKYCVETCYGFWNPGLWNDALTATLNSRKEQRKPYYDEIISILKDKDMDSELRMSFIKLCDRIQSYLVGINIFNWKYGKNEEALKAWDKWYANLLLKIDNEKFYNRLISGIASVPVPDVWNDPLSSTEFEDSFIESIIYHWSKEYTKETTNVIAQAISWNMDLGVEEKEETEIEQLKIAIDGWLEENPELSLVDFNEEE